MLYVVSVYAADARSVCDSSCFCSTLSTLTAWVNKGSSIGKSKWPTVLYVPFWTWQFRFTVFVPVNRRVTVVRKKKYSVSEQSPRMYAYIVFYNTLHISAVCEWEWEWMRMRIQKFNVQSKTDKKPVYVYYTNRTKRLMEKLKRKPLSSPESWRQYSGWLGGVGSMAGRISGKGKFWVSSKS